ncbi:unnamed protein product [Gongylonema pulchrum]|uniref:Uncharacterized protein n=1 Tax=Gongylonema pulchrum TaxID=637853 RepID=A0A183E539_9BILA|nr:unnamed protein product [Gongylonema pulchrum]
MSSGHPLHFIRQHGEKYSQKELLQAWITYLQKQCAIERARECELQLIKLREKASLFNRVCADNSDLTDEEVAWYLEKAREEDSKPEKYRALKIIVPPSHPLEVSGVAAPLSPIKPLFEGLTPPSQIMAEAKAAGAAAGRASAKGSPKKPEKYRALKIIVPPSHPLEVSGVAAPLSPIKPLFEGLTPPSQIVAEAKAAAGAAAGRGSAKGSPKKVRSAASSPRKSTSLEAGADEAEKQQQQQPPVHYTRQRTLSIGSPSAASNASSPRREGEHGRISSTATAAISTPTTTEEPRQSPAASTLATPASETVAPGTSEEEQYFFFK